jgi:hypothetical protein
MLSVRCIPSAFRFASFTARGRHSHLIVYYYFIISLFHYYLSNYLLIIVLFFVLLLCARTLFGNLCDVGHGQLERVVVGVLGPRVFGQLLSREEWQVE